MQARLLFSCAILALALASCGDDKSSDGGTSDAGGGEKQSAISAEAYPAVEQFLATTADVDKFLAGKYCDALAAVSDEDKVASVAEDACKSLRVLFRDVARRGPDIAKACNQQDACLADRAEPLLRDSLEGLRDIATAYNGGLDGALQAGTCLNALKLPESQIEVVNDSIEQLPGAMKRLRAGDKSQLLELFDDDSKFEFNEPDPKACKA